MTTVVYQSATTTAAAAGRGPSTSEGVVAVLASSVILATALTGTTATAPWRDVPVAATATVRGAWTGAVPLELTLAAATKAVQTLEAAPTAATLTDQDEIRWAKDHSGL